jgi:hypothetical protein
MLLVSALSLLGGVSAATSSSGSGSSSSGLEATTLCRTLSYTAAQAQMNGTYDFDTLCDDVSSAPAALVPAEKLSPVPRSRTASRKMCLRSGLAGVPDDRQDCRADLRGGLAHDARRVHE